MIKTFSFEIHPIQPNPARWLGPVLGLFLLFLLAGPARADWVNVKTWNANAALNATGNGVANDAPAVQAAINSLTNGGTLYFPAGRYLLQGTVYTGSAVDQNFALLITNGLTVQGDGSDASVLIQGNYRTTMVVAEFGTATAGFSMENLKLVADETSTGGYSATAAGVLLCGIGTGQAGAWTKGFRLHNVSFDDQGKNYALWMTHMDDVHVEHCRFTSYANTNNLANAGLGHLHTVNFSGTYPALGTIVVTGNYFDSDANGAGGNSQGDYGPLLVQGADTAVITGNYLANFTATAIACGAVHQTITGNVFETAKSIGPIAIMINPGVGAGTTNYQTVIANNIQTGGDSFLSTANIAGVSVDVAIVNNSVQLGNKALGIYGSTGINFNSFLACRTVIKGNALDNYGNYGISLSGTGSYDSSAVVQNNSLTSMSTAAPGAQCAVAIQGFQNVSVLNNTLSGGGNGQLVAYGLTTTTNVIGQLVIANNLYLNQTNLSSPWIRVLDAAGNLCLNFSAASIGNGVTGAANVAGYRVNYSIHP